MAELLDKLREYQGYFEGDYAGPLAWKAAFVLKSYWVGDLLYALIQQADGTKLWRCRGRLPNGHFIRTCEAPYEDFSGMADFIKNAALIEDSNFG